VPQKEEPDDPDLAAWRDIVENYGERAELPDASADDAASGSAVEQGQAYPLRFGDFGDDVDEPFAPVDDAVEEGFVPLEPEPVRLDPVRTVAWAGVLGAPLVALLATVVVTTTGLSVPQWFGWLLIASFLGGFAYLVVTMPRGRDDPWDDGARL
jgi:hypothetical protein